MQSHIILYVLIDIFGISDHDLMFSQEAQAEHHNEEEEGSQYVQQRVRQTSWTRQIQFFCDPTSRETSGKHTKLSLQNT